jgi:hypothetical protein
MCGFQSRSEQGEEKISSLIPEIEPAHPALSLVTIRNIN